MSRAALTRLLRAKGFTRMDTRHEPLIYEKKINRAWVRVRIWADGHHSVVMDRAIEIHMAAFTTSLEMLLTIDNIVKEGASCSPTSPGS